jgi:hypothetical protein
VRKEGGRRSKEERSKGHREGECFEREKMTVRGGKIQKIETERNGETDRELRKRGWRLRLRKAQGKERERRVKWRNLAIQ